MKERASLKRQIALVNQRATLSALFLLAACGNSGDDKADTEFSSLNGQIIWQTPKFGEPIAGFSIADDAPVEIMILNEESGVRIVDPDGAAQSDIGPYALSAAGQAVTADFDDAVLRIFPSLSKNSGAFTLLVNGSGLQAPIELPVNNAPSGNLKGLCSGASTTGDNVVQIAYWTDLLPDTLTVGEISPKDGEFVYTELKTITHEKYITSCGIDGDLIAAGGGFGLMIHRGQIDPKLIELPGVPTSTSAAAIGTGGIVATSLSNGTVYLTNAEGLSGVVRFQASLSADAPSTVGQVSIHTKGSIGSLSNGFLAAEAISGQSSQIIYLDLKTLTDQL